MTSPAFKLLATKNNATTPTLLGAIGASDTTIVLGTGLGAALPTILRGDCSSTGDARTLNDTGALASVAVGDYIYNLTDGSWAVVTTGGTNSIVTTPLEGGSDNLWESGDIWVVGMFMATITQFSGSTIVKQERILVTNRVSDTLTVVRAQDGDTGLSFLAGDSVQLLWEEAQVEGLHNAVRNIIGKIDAIHRGVPSAATSTGSSNAYVLTLAPVITSYASIAGKPIVMTASFSNTGACTVNVNGLGAKSIKKEGGATALASADITQNMPVVLVFNVTLDAFVMVNAVANTPVAPTVATYGTGADGSYTLNASQGAVAGLFSKSGSTFTLLRDANFINLTIDDTYDLKTNGFKIYGTGTMTLSGTGNRIQCVGGNAGHASNNTGGTAGAVPYTNGTLPNPIAGKAGPNGVGSGSGVVGVAGTAATNALGTAGATGGNALNDSPLGGAGGGVTTAAYDNNKIIAFATWFAGAYASFQGCGGAGSGASGDFGSSGPSGGGGGSGANGGYVYIAFNTITGSGGITVKGGDGGNGGNAGGNSGGGGGGSGGSGGVCILIYATSTYSGTVTYTGGASSLGGADSGSDGKPGVTGTTGVYITVDL